MYTFGGQHRDNLGNNDDIVYNYLPTGKSSEDILVYIRQLLTSNLLDKTHIDPF